MNPKSDRSNWLAELAQLKNRMQELESLLVSDENRHPPLPSQPVQVDIASHSTPDEDDGMRIPEIFFYKDAQARYVSANQAYCDFLGYPFERILGKTDFDLVSNEIAAKFSLEDQRILSGVDAVLENLTSHEFRGQTIQFSYRKLPILDEYRKIIGLICVGFDVSDLVKVKDDLKRERRLIRTLIDIVPDQIFARDRDCRFILNNLSDARMMGVTDPETLEGRSDKDFFPPELANRYQADDRQVMDSGQPLINREEPLTSADGQQHWLLTTKVPLFDESGEVIGLAGISRDITERKMAEKQLIEAMEENQESREFLQNILDTSPSYICWKDENLHFLGCNRAAARLFGLKSPEAIVGKSDVDFLDSSDAVEQNALADRRIMQSGQPEYRIQENGRDAQGNPVWFDTSKIPLQKPTGEVIGLLIFREDITVQKTIQDQLQQLNMELESFSYSVSHDLRGPLRHIISYSQILMEQYTDRLDAKGNEYFNTILSSAHKMNHLIEDILRLSRVTKIDLHLSKVDLCSLARGIVSNLQNDYPDRVVEIVIPDSILVLADESLLLVALDNLIRNAWKYTGQIQNPRIEFGTFNQNKKRVFFIKDNGVGFDMSQVNKLFSPFQRLHTEKEFSGTGVGLALVKRVILRHGGSIWAEGEVGRGASFFFTLDE